MGAKTTTVGASLLGALLCIGVITAEVNAAPVVIYDNGVSPELGWRAGNEPEERIADDFVLASDALLTGFGWRGFHISDEQLPPASEAFSIRVFADSGGIPGSLLYDQVVLAARSADPVGEFYDYSADAPVSLLLMAGTRYWFSLDPIDEGGWAGFYWAGTRFGTGNAVCCGPDEWSGADIELDFRLLGTPVTGVSEPLPLALMLLALAALALLQRRGARQ